MKKISPLFIALLILGACKKDKVAPSSVPVQFTATTYSFLGNYDTNGKPTDYLLTKDVISANLTSYLNTTLPERTDLRKSNPDLLTTKSIADITMTQKSDVFITFVNQGTGVNDAIAFYTYPTGSAPKTAADIKNITYIFPLAGTGTSLTAGDKVKIGTFGVGTSIGFVLLQNGWDPVKKTVVNDAVHFCSNDALNPEVDPNLKKHAVLINYTPENKVLIGFEDLDRTTANCDHDFNDIVVYATVTAAI
ncbi:MAG: DUF4114 domain-containing protein [Sphingobacteriaceae bacterium]|nr:MAG: DUF4114 domain-containing protein [Sphingobacteriaceae bacterium]